MEVKDRKLHTRGTRKNITVNNETYNFLRAKQLEKLNKTQTFVPISNILDQVILFVKKQEAKSA
jgi:hypothetical protein